MLKVRFAMFFFFPPEVAGGFIKFKDLFITLPGALVMGEPWCDIGRY